MLLQVTRNQNLGWVFTLNDFLPFKSRWKDHGTTRNWHQAIFLAVAQACFRSGPVHSAQALANYVGSCFTQAQAASCSVPTSVLSEPMNYCYTTSPTCIAEMAFKFCFDLTEFLFIRQLQSIWAIITLAVCIIGNDRLWTNTVYYETNRKLKYPHFGSWKKMFDKTLGQKKCLY